MKYRIFYKIDKDIKYGDFEEDNEPTSLTIKEQLHNIRKRESSLIIPEFCGILKLEKENFEIDNMPTLFKDLPNGAVFTFCDGQNIYMKTYNCENCFPHIINLNTGKEQELLNCYDNMKVQLYNLPISFNRNKENRNITVQELINNIIKSKEYGQYWIKLKYSNEKTTVAIVNVQEDTLKYTNISIKNSEVINYQKVLKPSWLDN